MTIPNLLPTQSITTPKADKGMEVSRAMDARFVNALMKDGVDFEDKIHDLPSNLFTLQNMLDEVEEPTLKVNPEEGPQATPEEDSQDAPGNNYPAPTPEGGKNLPHMILSPATRNKLWKAAQDMQAVFVKQAFLDPLFKHVNGSLGGGGSDGKVYEAWFLGECSKTIDLGMAPMIYNQVISHYTRGAA